MLVSTNYAENYAGTIKNLLARSPRKKKTGSRTYNTDQGKEFINIFARSLR